MDESRQGQRPHLGLKGGFDNTRLCRSLYPTPLKNCRKAKTDGEAAQEPHVDGQAGLQIDRLEKQFKANL